MSVKGLFILLSALTEMFVVYFDQCLANCCTLQMPLKTPFQCFLHFMLDFDEKIMKNEAQKCKIKAYFQTLVHLKKLVYSFHIIIQSHFTFQ